MTLIRTESFGAFERWSGTDAEMVARRAALQRMLLKFDMTAFMNTTGAWFVDADPVTPDRNVLRYCISELAATISNQAGLFIPAPPTNGKPLIFGFSLFVPANYPDLVGNTTTAIYFARGPAALKVSYIWPYADFVINLSRQVAANNVAAPSSQKLIRGAKNYIEARWYQGQVSVWMNDGLVYQGNAGNGDGGICLLNIRPQVTGVSLGDHNNWAFGDMYMLVEDDIPPNVRLGPSTRVIGRKVIGDVSTQFLRPSGFASNADVVNVPVTPDAPVATLQTDMIGARDEYVVNPNGPLEQAALVHAISTKVIAADLEINPHAIYPWVKSGIYEGADDDPLELVLRNVGENIAIICGGQREDGTIFVAGPGPRVFYSVDDGDTWALAVSYTGGSNPNGMAIGPDGTIRIGVSNGNVLVCQGSSGPTTWSVESTGVALVINSIAVSPTGTWVVAYETSSNVGVKVGAGNWTQVANSMGGQAVCNWVDDRFVLNRDGASGFQHSITATAGSWSAVIPTASRAAGYSGMYKVGPNFIFPGIVLSTSTCNMISSNALASGWVVRNVGVLREALGYNGGSMKRGANLANGGFVVPAPSGVFYTTIDGLNWNVYRDPRQTMKDVNGHAFATKDGFGIGSTGGKVWLLRKRKVVRPLLFEDGYNLHTNMATVNPATGLAWTNEEAVAATVGMTIMG